MKNKYIIIALFLVNSFYVIANSNAKELEHLEDEAEWQLDVSTANLLPNDYNSLNNYSSFSSDTDYNFSASLNYNTHLTGKLFQNTRLETEVFFSNSHSNGSEEDRNILRAGLMENAYYDFDTLTSVKPYIGTGIGVANVSIQDAAGKSGEDESFTLPAYQAMAGVTYQSETYPSAKANMGYKYFATIGRQTINNIEPALRNANTHSIEAGIKLGF